MTSLQYQEHFEQMAAQEEGTLLGAAGSSTVCADPLRSIGNALSDLVLALRKEQSQIRGEAGFVVSLLSSDSDYLHRYHCAAALVGMNSLSPAGWESHHQGLGQSTR